MRWMMTLLLGCTLLGGGAAAQDGAQAPPVNLDHLRYLTEPVTIDGQDMAVVHIYAEYPDYEWLDDADEGISAVDDVARAAVVYLWEYERTGDASLLDLARRCLNFVMYMQADDGEFYNFVWDREGRINERGGTSFKSLGWWAMRGLWALGEGVRIFDHADPAYADVLAEAYTRTENAIAATLGNYGEVATLHGFDIPAWIPASESTIASVGLLGMSAYYQARPNEATAEVITQVADGVAQYRLGDHSTYPFGMHPTRSNAPGFWHNWGAHMPHALAVAGMMLDRQDWIDSAAATADSFLLRQLAFEPFRHIGVVPYRLEQIAYGTNMLVQAYAALHQATGEDRYAHLAALAGSWFFGNNMAGVQMYYPETGRTFDGINGPVSFRVNRNAGAESTIEGLMSMSALARLPEDAVPFVYAETLSETRPMILEAESAQRVVGTPIYYSGNWTGEGYISAGRYVGLGEGQRMRMRFALDEDQAGDYLIYAAAQRQAPGASAYLIPQVAAAPQIDGLADDWPSDALLMTANTARQFLRGAGLWEGPGVDSHAVRLTWDNDNLYVLAQVRDPEHVQEGIVSGVWQGDTLWLYFTDGPDARALTAKVTLAQTPQGPQVWDWLGAGFLEGAALAWLPGEDGASYAYEAALPWASLGIDAPAAGNSFMDLTGRDPDVAANLLQLTLTAPGAEGTVGSAPQVALAVRIDDGDDIVIDQSISPDTDYFWLDLVTPEGVALEAGEHTLRFEYAGEEGASNPGISRIDAFVIQPVTGRRVVSLPDGRQFTLTYNTLTGDSALEDTTSQGD
jgi:hypothetical protein